VTQASRFGDHVFELLCPPTRILGQPVSLGTSKTKEPEQGLLDVVCDFDIVQTIVERLIHGF
jgi:hypothetical protein